MNVLQQRLQKKSLWRQKTKRQGVGSIPEITVKAVILGIILSIVLAAANAYLGMFAGMTVSASIPAAVVSLGILGLFKRSNVLENNIVQTAASAGESVAAGVIFTIPALVMMGYWENFDILEITKIAALGGTLGVLFTIPLRRALIVQAKLKYPEGVATAAVLEAGDKALQRKRNKKTEIATDEKTGVGILVASGLFAGFMKLCTQGFHMWNSMVAGSFSIGNATFGAGTQLSPCLVAIGYIVGVNIATVVIIGSFITWFIALPVYCIMAGHPLTSFDAAGAVWSTELRYLGIGAMVVGGLYAIFKLIKPLVDGVKASLEAVANQKLGKEVAREEKDMPIKWVGIAIIFSLIPLILYLINVLHSFPIAIIVSLVMIVCGFLFSSVAGYMAGLVGSSNNPLSGMTICTILFTALLLLLLMGAGNPSGAAAAIIVGAVICCAGGIAGDNLQDLKAGHILGATPWKQQVMQIVGAVAAACAMGYVLKILHAAYTIGSPKLSAPQATLMKSIAEGVFKGGMPWGIVFAGAGISIIIIIIDIILEKKGSEFRMPVLAAAVGIYLPIDTTLPIFIGGLLVWLISKAGTNAKSKHKGLLLASGFITGEALIGVIVAIPIFLTGNADWWPKIGGFSWLGIVLFIAALFWIFQAGRKRKEVS